MGDHDAQRDRRMARQFGAHRRMAVQIDIAGQRRGQFGSHHLGQCGYVLALGLGLAESLAFLLRDIAFVEGDLAAIVDRDIDPPAFRSEEHTSELQSLMRISYAVFCLKKKKISPTTRTN